MLVTYVNILILVQTSICFSLNKSFLCLKVTTQKQRYVHVCHESLFWKSNQSHVYYYEPEDRLLHMQDRVGVIIWNLGPLTKVPCVMSQEWECEKWKWQLFGCYSHYIMFPFSKCFNHELEYNVTELLTNTDRQQKKCVSTSNVTPLSLFTRPPIHSFHVDAFCDTGSLRRLAVFTCIWRENEHLQEIRGIIKHSTKFEATEWTQNSPLILHEHFRTSRQVAM